MHSPSFSHQPLPCPSLRTWGARTPVGRAEGLHLTAATRPPAPSRPHGPPDAARGRGVGGVFRSGGSADDPM